MKHHRLLAVSAFLMLAIPVAHAADKSPGEQVEERFSQMQTLIDQARQAKTPQDRQKLVTEHMKLMQEQMSAIDALSPKIGQGGTIGQDATIVQSGMMPPAGTIGPNGLIGQGRVMGQGRLIGQDGTTGQGKVMGPPKDSNTMDMKPPAPILTMPQRMDLMQRMMGQMLQEQQVVMMPAQ